MAGHSLGELAALVAAGSLDESDGLSLAVTRGRVMQDAAERALRAACSRRSGTGTRRSRSPSASV